MRQYVKVENRLFQGEFNEEKTYTWRNILMSENRIPDKTLLNAITERIVATVQPRRIVLFGSAAEGRMGPDNDIDLLIIMPDGVHRRNTARVIYRKLSGMGFSKDIIVVTENDILKNRDNPSLVIHPALKHGKELYHATR
jgi:predicted nucleotidyltransferase